MIVRLFRLTTLVSLFFGSCIANSAIADESSTQRFILSAQEWAIPRSASRVVEIPALSQALNQLISQPDQGLLIRYPGGDRGQWWANELKAWLLSLGVGPKQLELRPGPVDEDMIELQVVSQRMLFSADN